MAPAAAAAAARAKPARRAARAPKALPLPPSAQALADARALLKPVGPAQKLTKGHSLRQYCLQPRHLLALRPELRRNPHYARAAPMQLFLEAELQALAVRVHGGVEGLARVLDRSKARLKRRLEKAATRLASPGGS